MATKEEKAKKEKEAKQASEVKDLPYHKITISCACGASYESGSTLESIRVDICSNCHPFFTGDKRIVDAEGRVEKFKKKYNMN